MQFDSVQCNWQILDNSHKILLGVCLIVFGALGVLLNLWLLITFVKSTSLISRNYLFILAYCIACLVRGLMTGFPISAITAFYTRWGLGGTGCHLFAYSQLVIGIFQMCCITALAIERYLVIKFYMRGTQLSFKFYTVGLIICWLIAVLASIFPLLGIGRYYCDMSDTVCDIDWRMIYTKNIPYNSIIISLLGILPAIISISCFIIALVKERKVLMERRSTTQALFIMTILTFVFWTPKGILIIFTSLSLKISKALIIISAISSEASTILPVITYLIFEPMIRKAMIMVLFSTLCSRTAQRRRHISPHRTYKWSSVK